MDEVKRAADDARDQLQSNGFHLDPTLKSQDNSAKEQEGQFLPFSEHSAALHKPWLCGSSKPMGISQKRAACGAERGVAPGLMAEERGSCPSGLGALAF